MTATPPSQSSSTHPLTLAERIDLDAFLAADAGGDESVLRSRDGAIGRRAGAAGAADEQAVRAWLAERREPGVPTLGASFTHTRRTMGSLLAVAGLLIGFCVVGGWLITHSGRPVNVIHFWAAVVGVQLLLLIPFGMAIIRLVRAPGADQADAHLPRRSTQIGLWLERGFVRLAERSPTWASRGEQLQGLIGRLRAAYGRTLGWIGLRATQSFAVAFNVGAVAALLIFSVVSDPAFGWRSTLLNEHHVHVVARVLAAPFSFTGWGTPPGLETVNATRYSSLEGWTPGSHDPATWSAWFQFLLMSIVVYGLTVRVVTHAICRIGEGRALAATPWKTAAADQLLRRLRRFVVTTTAAPDDTPDAPPAYPGGVTTRPAIAPAATGGPVTILRWSGVKVDDTALLSTATRRLHAQPASTIHTVGSLDLTADRAALDRAAAESGMVALIVEGWEPPVADHVDFLRGLRAAVGPSLLIHVLVAGLSRDHQPAAPTAAQLATWRAKLASLPDPYLAVEPLVEPAA